MSTSNVITIGWLTSFRAKEISQERLQQAWREHFPSTGFPSVRAWTLRPQYFSKWYKQLVASEYTLNRDVEKFGSPGLFHLTCAFVIRGEEVGYCIFRNSASRFTEEDDLAHELDHISRGEVELIPKSEKS